MIAVKNADAYQRSALYHFSPSSSFNPRKSIVPKIKSIKKGVNILSLVTLRTHITIVGANENQKIEIIATMIPAFSFSKKATTLE